MTWEKLSDPSEYGAEEYFILSLITFVIFVMVKHLVFHTFYYWWYREGRLYIPEKIRDALTGKTQPQRLYEFVKSKTKIDNDDSLIENIEQYCTEKEFALTLGREKGKVLDKVVAARKPNRVLVCGSLCGYSALCILRASPSSHVYVIEPDEKKFSYTKQMANLAKKEDHVTVIAATSDEAIPKLKQEYNIEKLDFIFLTSTTLGKPTHHKVLKLLEESDLFYRKKEGVEGPSTVILADKVVHFGEAEFLKHVRYSDNYETEYHQMPLEYSPNDIIDGMEKVVYVGKV